MFSKERKNWLLFDSIQNNNENIDSIDLMGISKRILRLIVEETECVGDEIVSIEL